MFGTLSGLNTYLLLANVFYESDGGSGAWVWGVEVVFGFLLPVGLTRERSESKRE